MNERIRRLMEQTVTSIDGQTFGKTYIPDAFTEKFAELIVRECAVVADQWVNDEDNGHNLVSAKLKQHFGVEE